MKNLIIRIIAIVFMVLIIGFSIPGFADETSTISENTSKTNVESNKDLDDVKATVAEAYGIDPEQVQIIQSENSDILYVIVDKNEVPISSNDNEVMNETVDTPDQYALLAQMYKEIDVDKPAKHDINECAPFGNLVFAIVLAIVIPIFISICFIIGQHIIYMIN